MPEVFNTGTNLSIEEQSGDKRTLTLGGRALPYRGVSFSGTMRADFTWYPGNPQATVQVLGAAEDETTMNGKWKDRFLNLTTSDGKVNENSAIAQVNGTDVGSAELLVETVDDIRRKGQLVVLRWGRIVRTGILLKFHFTIDNRHDIAWEMTFQWISQDPTTVPAVIAKQNNLSSVAGSWNDFADKITSALADPPWQEATAFVGKLNSTVTSIQSSISDIGDAVSAATQTIVDTVSTAQRLASVYSEVIDKATSVIGGLTSQWESLQFVFIPDEGEDEVTSSFINRLGALEWKRNIYDLTKDSRAQAALQQYDALKQAVPDVLAVFVARQDTDLREVSTFYYGNQNNWRAIQTFNNLTTSNLTAGQIVLVPELRSV